MPNLALAWTLGLLVAAPQAETSPPQDARPNIVLILSDDMGYSDLGCFGGEIATPNLDALAEGGLRYTQFTNCARCCPTRASLLTGLYPHQVGIGHMTSESANQSQDKGVRGYRGILSPASATLAEVLGAAGYRTAMSGKWHVGTFEEAWPTARGFDAFSGMIRGASNFFRPSPDKLLMENGVPIEPPADFYATDSFTDWALGFVDAAEEEDERPFFLYLGYTAPHWPLHAHPEDIAKYRGRYVEGWDTLRAERFQRMVAMGLVDEGWGLSPRDASSWESLDDAQRDELDLRMAIYAAQVDRMDQNIGRLVEKLDSLGELENTLILFMNDNGGCAEGGEFGGGPAAQLETREGYWLSYGRAWANASNTPFRRYKHWIHEGGIATPMIAHWPRGIEARGELRTMPGHVIDVMPTFVEVADATYPVERAGHSVPPMEGRSLVGSFEGKAGSERSLFWEHEGNVGVRRGPWKLVAPQGGDWELYDLRTDRSELRSLATEDPERARALEGEFLAWAQRVGVLPFPVRRPAGYAPDPRAYPATWEDLRDPEESEGTQDR